MVNSCLELVYEMVAKEELLLEVEGKLFSLESSQPLRGAEILKVHQQNFSGKTKFEIIRFLSQTLESLLEAAEIPNELSLTLAAIRDVYSPPPLEGDDGSVDGGDGQDESSQSSNGNQGLDTKP